MIKKIVIIVLFLFFLTGCVNNESTTTISTTTESTSANPITTSKSTFRGYIGYVSTVEITEERLSNSTQYPGLVFFASYQDVAYSAVSNSICTTVLIGDSNYRGATYYLVGRYVGDQLNEKRFVFAPASESTEYKACFNGLDLSRRYEILVAKNDTDAPQSHSTLLSMKTLTFFDPNASERSSIYFVENESVNSELVEMNEKPSYDYTPTFLDKGRTISSMSVYLTTKDNKIIEESSFEITEDFYVGDNLHLPTIAYTDLAPGLNYKIKTVISGNDGIDDFEDLTVMTVSFSAPTYEGEMSISNIQYDLYAAITGLEVMDGNVIYHYVVHNVTDEEHDFQAIVSYSDIDHNDYNLLIDLDPLNHQFSVPVELLSYGSVVTVMDTSTNQPMMRRVIDSNFNYYNMSYQYGERGKISFEIGEIDDYNETLQCYLEIFDSNHNLLETVDLNEYSPGVYYVLDVETAYQDYPDLYGIVTYQVNCEIGLVTRSVKAYLLIYITN